MDFSQFKTKDHIKTNVKKVELKDKVTEEKSNDLMNFILKNRASIPELVQI